MLPAFYTAAMCNYQLMLIIQNGDRYRTLFYREMWYRNQTTYIDNARNPAYYKTYYLIKTLQLYRI